MIGLLILLLQQGPDAQYAGGASSKIAGATALTGAIFRYLFTTVPQWVQIAGILIGVPVACIVVWQLWKHRRALWAWWVGRSLLVKTALSSAVLVVMAAVVGSGLYGYNFLMHENDFCQSCHVMDTAWNRAQVSAHKNIQCHGCHRQPLYVSSVELFWWVVERRMAIPPHDKVPTAVCNECHMRQGTDSARTLVTLTAGHVMHLKSDSSALKDVQCVTCHGRTFHVLKPTTATCAQSGCHTKNRVNLGAMSQRGFFHCTSCHDFRSLVPPGTTVAQARLALGPKVLECDKCHAMSQQMRSYDLAADPHKGNCGMCHDPHKQTEPKDAFKTCATAQCHASADTLTAFHRGLGNHALDQCGACHQAHSWKVKGTNCVACHENINKDQPRARRVSLLVRPAAFARPGSRVGRSSGRRGTVPGRLARFASFVSTTRATRRGSTWAPVAFVQGTAPPRRDSAFLHSRHTSIQCTQCHSTTSSHGGLTFARPAGCIGCHHGAEQRTACTKCHATASLTQYVRPVTFAITARRDPVTRPLTFAHERHDKLACTRCHGNDVKRTTTATCANCHADHHTTLANCAGCHPTARTGHDRASHAGCASCHTDATVAALPASGPVCLTCHQDQRTHYPTGDCVTCHALDHGMMRAGRVGSGR